MDLSPLVSELHRALNAPDEASLVWWTNAELWGYLDEAAQRLARTAACHVERDGATVLNAGQSQYAVPVRHMTTIHLSAGNRALKPGTVADLEALDDAWPSTQAAPGELPQRWAADVEGVDKVAVHPTTGTGVAGFLAFVFVASPVGISAGQTAVTLPEVLRDYFYFAALADALLKESKGAKPEVGAWCRDAADLLASAAAQYWGRS